MRGGGRTIAEIGVYEPIVLGYVGISIHKPITIPPTGKIGVADYWVHGIMGVVNQNVTENGLS